MIVATCVSTKPSNPAHIQEKGMKIHRLEVRNFRGFEHRTFNFPKQFTVLIGDNGTGKTAILDALAVGADSLFAGFDRVSSRPISDEKVRRVRYVMGDIPTIEPQYPVLVSCQGLVDGHKVRWERIAEKAAVQSYLRSSGKLISISQKLQEKVRNGQDALLPLIAYYGTGRLWLQKEEKSVETIEPESRMQGYIDCLDPASNQKQLLRWFKTMEMASLQKGEPIKVLDAFKSAVTHCIENCRSIKYAILEDELIVEFNDGHILPFWTLSDGVRNVLGMVADIAHRAAVLNPQLEREAARKTPGIVLIDEIDLHLHPKWQRRVVEDLQQTFPTIQFVATTHSPFIVQSLSDGELLNLDPQSIEEYHDKSIEDITENVMGVEMPQKSERYLTMIEAAEKYYQVLQEAKNASSEELKQLKDRLDELTIPFSDNPAYHAFLKMEREASGIG